MNFFAACYRQQGEKSASVLLQQYQYRQMEVIFACVCGEDRDGAGGYMTERLLAWFRRLDLGRLARSPERQADRLQAKLAEVIEETDSELSGRRLPEKGVRPGRRQLEKALPEGELSGGELTRGELTGELTGGEQIGELTGGEQTGGELTGELTGGEQTGGEQTGGELTGELSREELTEKRMPGKGRMEKEKVGLAVFLCIGDIYIMFCRGRTAIYLINTAFGRVYLRRIGAGAEKSGMVMELGKLQADIGLLLGTESFYGHIAESMIKEGLAVREIRTEKQMERHLTELAGEAERRGGAGMGAILLRTVGQREKECEDA